MARSAIPAGGRAPPRKQRPSRARASNHNAHGGRSDRGPRAPRALGFDSGLNALNTISTAGLAVFALGAMKHVADKTDPEKRRAKMAEQSGGSELKSVATYFEGEGFQRWRRIYDDAEQDVNKVQLDIRTGHAQTIEKALAWIDPTGAKGDLKGLTVCDAGCGTGSLTVPLALKGAKCYASDISAAMVKEAGDRFDAQAAGNPSAVRPDFEAKNLEEISGEYDVVTCLDVIIHYPEGKMEQMVEQLAGCAQKRLIISFAPRTPYYAVLKRIGELFPGKSKATRAYLHAESDVEAALERLGWKVSRREMTATSFYFSRMLEAVKA